ncbi:MAG: anthranilate synthase component I, partial [Chloroflexi bacterium]
MLSLTLDEVRVRAERAPMVPVFREALADALTPVSAFAALAADGPAYLLESVEGGERLGRYSFVASDPMAVITIRDGTARLANESGSQVLPGRDPLDALQRYLAGFRAEPSDGLPRFCGGAVGYLGYEAARYLERVPLPDSDPLGVPDGVFLISDTLVCFDHVQHRLKLITHVRPGPLEAAYRAAAERLDALEARLTQPVQLRPLRAPRPGGTMDAVGQRSREEFFAAVERAKAYILAGDIYQVQVAQRFQSPVSTDPFDIYRVLRTVNPSPYMYFLRLPELTVLGTSPEILVTVAGRQLRYRPIAGTRRRGRDPEHDQRMEAELRSSEKERAEHVMLVDLGRNDLGRVAEVGTVKVTDLMTVER